jgi:hypothetical protein
MKAGTATNQNLKDLLCRWLAQLADDAAEKHGVDSEQFMVIAHMQANIDDVTLSNLRLAD